MQYSLYQGIQNRPIENVKTFIRNLRHRNWLPAAVGSMMVLWISLLMVNIMQQVPVSPGAPTVRDTTKAPTVKVQTVASTSPASLAVTNASTFSRDPVKESSSNVIATNTDVTDQEVVGGRGYEAPTVVTPSNPAVTPPTDIVDDTVGGIGDTVGGVGEIVDGVVDETTDLVVVVVDGVTTVLQQTTQQTLQPTDTSIAE